MGCPFICLINSEHLSIFNHQNGNEINNLMMPATPPPPPPRLLLLKHTHSHTHTHTHTHTTQTKWPVIVAFNYELHSGRLQRNVCLIKIYDSPENKEHVCFFELMPESHPLSFHSACVSDKSHGALWVHTVPPRSGACYFTGSHLPYLRPKFTVRGLVCPPPPTPPCESTPPLLSLTRIASILALVKLTSSLNYANKAVVICICTAWWHVELGWGGGVYCGIHPCGEGS